MKGKRIGWGNAFLILVLAVCSAALGVSRPALGEALAPPERIVIIPNVEISQQRVSLLDLCQPGSVPKPWDDLFKKEDVGRAPSVSANKYILGEHLRSYLERFFSNNGCDPSNIEMIVPERISIARASVRITNEQIETIYKEFILSHSPWNANDLQIHRIYFSDAPALPLGQMSHEVIADPLERFFGNVTVTIQFFVDGEKERSVRVTGKVDLFQNVVHALKPVNRNDVIRESDLEFQRINVADDPDRFATRVEQVVGKQLLRAVGVHQPISLADLDQPTVVKRGGIVTIVYLDGGLKLTAKGEANGDACVGDTIKVTNLMTHRIAICQVRDGKTVHVVH